MRNGVREEPLGLVILAEASPACYANSCRSAGIALEALLLR